MKRPFSVTSLLWMVLCLTAWNAIRLGASIADWDTLTEFAPRPGPLYISASASFWTLSGLALFGLILRRNVRVPLFSAMYFFGYAAWWWLDRLLLQQARPNWPFAIILTFIFLASASIDIFSRKVKNYFHQRETNDQQDSDSNTA